MKTQLHISESRLLQAAKREIRLDPSELRHMESCPQCVDRLAKLVTKLVEDKNQPGSAK